MVRYFLLTVLVACGRVEFDAVVTGAVVVEPTYPRNGLGWNDLVTADGPDPYAASDTACVGTEPGRYGIACIHGGEKRKVVIGGVTSCAGLAATDELGAFEWTCKDDDGRATFHSLGLVYGKGLRDLVDAGGFKPNAVAVRRGGMIVAASDPAVWWPNPVEPLPANAGAGVTVLGSAGTVYLLDHNATSDGYNLDADRIAVVVAEGAALTWSGGPLNCRYQTGEIALPNIGALLCAGSQRYLWLEGDLVAGDRAVELVDVRFSRLNQISDTGTNYNAFELDGCASNLITGLFEEGSTNRGIEHIGASPYNAWFDITVQGSAGDGIWINGPTDSVFDTVLARSNAGYGLRVYIASQRNILRNIWVFDNGNTAGLAIHGANNRAYHVRAARNNGSGVDIRGDGNVIAYATLYSNAGSGLRFFDNHIDNTATHIVAFNNGAPTGSGVSQHVEYDRNTWSHITAVNNGSSGVSSSDFSSDTNISQVLSVNNGAFGLAINTNTVINHIVSQLVVAHNELFGIDTNSSGPNMYTGGLWVANNNSGGEQCESFGPAIDTGLIDVSCCDSYSEGCVMYTGQSQSNATLHVAFELSQSFVGKLVADDDANASDASGSQGFGSISDWFRFDNEYRGWGTDGSTFPAAANRGWCDAGQTCRIWDWRLSADDTVLRDVNGVFIDGAACPDSVHGTVALTDKQTTPNTYLVNAVEVLDDGAGDDDGLCESDETCIYSPNLGAYQGEGDYLNRACVFQDGLVSRVTMHAYPINGQP